MELEGNLKNELAAMIYYFVRKRPGWGFTLKELNRAIHKYAWPGGYKPPTFTEGYLEKGTKQGLAKTGCHVHMTAGDMMIFARHSIDVMLPLIKDTSDPLWQCWVAHIQYFRLLLKHQLTHAEVLELDRLIFQHHQMFLDVCKSEYGARMFKPKNHLASHFPRDILNLGPVRHYWCMRFEALNQLFKSFAAHGSFKDTCGRCAEFWSMQAAMLKSLAVPSSTLATKQVKVIHAKAPRKYTKDSFASEADFTKDGFVVVEGIMDLLQRDSIQITWVNRLQFGSTEVFAGQSWLSATLDGKPILAFISEHGVFQISNRIFFMLLLYPLATRDSYGMPSSTIPTTFTPDQRVVRVDSSTLTDVMVLWPSFRAERGRTVVYRFVPMSA